jgi:hypothetical protein
LRQDIDNWSFVVSIFVDFIHHRRLRVGIAVA